MTPSADYMVNYREGRDVVRIADDRAMPIKGIGSLPTTFWSGKDRVQVIFPMSLMSYSWDINYCCC